MRSFCPTRPRIRFLTVLTGLCAVAALATGCSGSDGATGDSSAKAAKEVDPNIHVTNVPPLGKVLTDSKGMVLYVNNVDKGAKIKCTGACAAVWKPVEVAGGSVPAKLSGINGTFAVVKRPDGMKQLAMTGHPLYTFTLDTKPKQAKGNMVTDKFGGTHFTWHVATATGAIPHASPSPTASKGYN